MHEAIQAIVTAFPDVPILPVIGNNDVKYHDQAPKSDDKDSYYADLWKLYFEEVPANSEILANSTIKETFMEGGYYAYELGDDTMLININGMYPFY